MGKQRGNDMRRIGLFALAAAARWPASAPGAGQLPHADREDRAAVRAGLDHRHPGAAHRRSARPQMGQADRGRKHRRRQHEHRRGAGRARGARRLHAVRRAAGADRARASADEEHQLQSARLGADHDAGEDRQRAVGPQHACRSNTLPGADRLRQGQSGQAHLRDPGPDLDRASVGGAARGAGRHQDAGGAPIAARSRRSPTSSPATSTCSSTRSPPRCRCIAPAS